MFRLIQLHTESGVPRIGVDPDGYASARAALAHYRTAPATYFAVGRFDHEGTLTEVILDPICGLDGACQRPASVIHAQTYERLCERCASGLDVLTVPQLARRLGIACRLAPSVARFRQTALGGLRAPSGNRIAREFPDHVHDPAWRQELCISLTQSPTALNGLLIGVGALSHRQVLDLFPALCALGDELPDAIHSDLTRATARPLSPAGVAGLRLGLRNKP
ncbi:hypothetical protein Aph02nite_07570 [Actinoplanes philippinensis]|uniref:Uncharacterized protein n=1 Tax=Actinoplanes philippinensis TaxID=35752 RepID=A0A1I2CLQ3_9ACTN|nr:hypothetical protein [Actinoplanes philippinensis]GIE74807.1 hypothetical protein Aph02nite_07570 [Actinoplanes philippinensis]SFE69256.1 hypothetical protein SAMN05421541_10376 [Actinoplanes philippinensis]